MQRSAARRKEFGKIWGKFRAEGTLIVSKLDRVGRDTPGVLATIKSLAALDVEVVGPQLVKLHRSSTPGELILAVLAAVAKLERDSIVEHT